MDCRQAQEWLLDAEDPHAEGNPGVAGHVRQCSACRAVADDLTHLETTYRGRPTPPEAAQSRTAFLRRLPDLAAPAPRLRLPFRPLRWALAASLLLALGMVPWFLAPAPQAQAAPLVERLVDWNLEMTQANTPADRGRLLQAEPELRAAFEKADLPEEDRELAGQLLENGRWLAANNDPVAEAERFSVVADQIVRHLEHHASRGEAERARRFAGLQQLVAERGVAANLERAEASGVLNFEKRGRLEKIILGDARRMEALAELLRKSPDATRKEIKKALDLTPKHPKGKARGKGADKAPPPPTATSPE